jgi:hypothetical protein
MNSQQPRWSVAANLGDANPLEHGGDFVLVDTLGVYDPELWRFDADTMQLARFSIDQCHPLATGGVGDNAYHPFNPAWFGSFDDLARVAAFVGNVDLRRHLCGHNVIERAAAYIALCDYHGVANFDSYPVTLTRAKAAKLIRRLLNAIKSGRPFDPATR